MNEYGFYGSDAEYMGALRQAVVEAMGRVNFGQEAHDRKGLVAPVKLVSAGNRSVELTGWEVFPVSLEERVRSAASAPCRGRVPPMSAAVSRTIASTWATAS